jgi:hypothetical protein
MATEASHASKAVAVPNIGVAPHIIGLINVGHVMTGGVESSTEIVALHVEKFPHKSVAVHVLVSV